MSLPASARREMEHRIVAFLKRGGLQPKDDLGSLSLTLQTREDGTLMGFLGMIQAVDSMFDAARFHATTAATAIVGVLQPERIQVNYDERLISGPEPSAN